MSEFIEALKPELYNWCEEDHQLDLQVAEEEDFSKPHLWLRFLDDPMDFHLWHGVELRHLNKEIDSHMVQHFDNTLPKGQTIVNKIMVSKVGFTQAAIVMAGQLGVQCINFAQDAQSGYYGYLVPVVSSQTIDSPEVLSQREWQQIHQKLEESCHKHSKIEALVVDPQTDQQYTWANLEGALPVITPYETTDSYVYDFHQHRLQVTGFDPLPIEKVTFKYFTAFRVLDGREEAEAVAELLEKVILD